MKYELNVKRVSVLMKNDVLLHQKSLGMTALTIAVLLAVLPFHVTQSATAFYLLLYVGGFVLTAFAFRDFHHGQKSCTYD